MSNRREVLQMAMAVTVLPLDTAAWAAPSVDANRGRPAALYKALYDTRFAASRAFSEHMAAHGVATSAMSGDVTAFWYDNLYPRWSVGTIAPIAGLTARGPLFCLERLAWDHGMRVVFRAQHSASTAGAVLHEIEGGSILVDAVQRVEADGNWVGVVSDAIGHYPHTGTVNARVQLHTAKPTVQVPVDEILFSWVIAPIARS